MTNVGIEHDMASPPSKDGQYTMFASLFIQGENVV